MIDLYRLLDRPQIHVDADGSYLTDKRVLVTGAGGSIGSVLCQHIATHKPAELIMLDRDESALHAVQLALTGRALLDDQSTVLADIRDEFWIHRLMQHLNPDVVFHAAALKHQPLLERYPGEALKTNVIGTLNVLRSAMCAGVETLVNISTDKAADPTCVLGASKRIAERLTAWFPSRYVSVRFGNVIDSRGAVLETFRRQLAAGHPLTVTDPQVSRYFMTSDEAISLVVHAGAIGKRGEVLVLDMGQQVMIRELAERMIIMNGGGEIVYTGLRPGEKLMEDLLGFEEPDLRPHHPLITHVSTYPLLPSNVDTSAFASHSIGSDTKKQLLALCTR
jgi:FlaA1/EpsC-like NDP-sugar epimerase